MDWQQVSRLMSMVGELSPGTVSLVGAGPGDSTLITLRGAVRVTQADVVLHDKLIGPELLGLVRPDAERIFVGKWPAHGSGSGGASAGPPGGVPWTQERINEAMVAHARAGRRVVRLKGGDPFVFGRGGEECEYLARHGVAFEVVPGITAAFGAPATAGIPLTHRGLSRSFTLVTGHADPGDGDGGSPLNFAALARMETIAIYMGVRTLDSNCRQLIDAGMKSSTPVAVIQWGTRCWQRTVIGDLATIAAKTAVAGIQPPALVLIGEVVRMRESIEWFERRPLHGQVIAVTRMRGQADSLAGELTSLGAEVIEAPTIALAPMVDYSAVDEALRHIGRYAWLVLTSANGVDATFGRLAAMGLDSRALAGVKIAAVGTATAARMAAYGIKPDLVPGEAVGEALAEALVAQGIAGQRVLLLRAEVARRVLNDALAAAGAACDDLAVYRTVCPEQLPEEFVRRFDRGEIGWITLTSPSSWYNLLSLLGPQRAGGLYNVKLASIGPVTTRAIRERGYAEAVEADPHDVAGLVAAIRGYVHARSGGAGSSESQSAGER
ncbi:MAG TPA: uroporphyrinogen-III C-methyltransferase [Phycisphaerae bacterium]|nr:uroporphyrinogen-III C-methyltransferase [Phycisphaerae bacterium]HOM51538.1 uroporphyrinogen-III C-methyltransferase [Phycisphaerae bacterium]HPP27066.1 uroporphyrinogen-III C-methyltransferase [Phycisphaerae bacterium]HPU27843.1 uroporphyrinogen-III C-methyltransferase [Phycisphaerae bacterium]